MRQIDEFAKKWGMPSDILIPIAARSIEAINIYIGKVSKTLIESKAFLLELDSTSNIIKKSAIWKIKEAEILHYSRQVWVHVNYTGYRKAYKQAFPELDLSKLVIDHIMNRRVARLKGFEYIRVIPISREANTNSGTITEKYGFEYHSAEEMKRINSQNKASIKYADLADVVKMLNLRTGGTYQDGINEAQKYLLEG